MSQPFDFPAPTSSFTDESPWDILKAASKHFGDELWISFSGAEDVALIDMAWKLSRNVKVFSLDTGRLHPKTYCFIDQVREHYGIVIDALSPDLYLPEPLMEERGLSSFYRDDYGECCGIRKIEPLECKLAGVRAWATGQHRGQSPDTRGQMVVLKINGAFSVPEKPLYKFNPPSSTTSEEIWSYICMFKLPYNSPHGRSYTSIGCEPCARPVLPNQHEREGHWWWEEAIYKECRLRIGNLISKI